MINKQNDDNQPHREQEKDTGMVDVAHMDIQVHLKIKDKDTGETLVNQRG